MIDSNDNKIDWIEEKKEQQLSRQETMEMDTPK
jgi:hypothetical protein